MKIFSNRYLVQGSIGQPTRCQTLDLGPQKVHQFFFRISSFLSSMIPSIIMLWDREACSRISTFFSSFSIVAACVLWSRSSVTTRSVKSLRFFSILSSFVSVILLLSSSLVVFSLICFSILSSVSFSDVFIESITSCRVSYFCSAILGLVGAVGVCDPVFLLCLVSICGQSPMVVMTGLLFYPVLLIPILI